ncbi:branched-chain amino acid ABC transporter ATP-binding protein/permease [Burkholderia ambifaria]|uniref:branched-chain amino acid ABC transporter ATP-binding protein/permease n=1 Tax=Burkholderia ambifaria TaxID=152480 RepID=UPI001B9A27CC|nr:branched-chain amino acid ABC transporter ATP-binding protein/permease [Burkholderia ambifaria]MBR8257583.1 ATP-binding cassette domain-containing protein [Burkholderia ambifaria]
MKHSKLFSHPVALALTVLLVISLVTVASGAPLSRMTQIAIYTLYGVGVNFLIGYLGLVPFGASFFFGCASYAVAIGMSSWMPNEIAALAVSAIFSFLLAAIVGFIILRRRGLYFSLLTLACSQIAFEVAYKWTTVTGGENGLQNSPRILFVHPLSFHVFALTVVGGGLYVLWRIAHSPFGRVMQALRDNEQRVTTLGFNTFALKLVAFCIAGTAVGVAGGLLALLLQGAYANNLNWQHAGDAVLMAALGGIHHFLGPLWGAILFIVLEDRLSAITDNWWLLFAPIIIVFALLSTEGVHGALQRLLGRKRRWSLTRAGIPARPASIDAYQVSAGSEQNGPLLRVTGMSKRFGSIVTSNDISIDVHRNQLHSFIGPNGAGKSTFFHILSGLLNPDSGRIEFNGTDITRMPAYRRVRLGLSRSFQILSVFPNLTAFDNVRIAVQASRGQWWGFWRDAYTDASENARVWTLLDAVGLADRAGEICSDLSHGEKRLLEIAVSLATDARLLLLDEPLAGLAEADRRVVSELITRLAKTHAVLLIEHDIDRVLALSDRITVLHQGRLIADGKPAMVAAHPEVIAAYLGKKREDTSGDGGSVTKRADVQLRDTTSSGCVDPAAPADVLLRLEAVRSGYGGSTVLDGLDFEVRHGEVVALLGRNGVGKTTALRTVMGMLPTMSGHVHFEGRDVTGWRPSDINRTGISMVPEGRRLFPNLTVRENLMLAARSGGASLDEIHALFPKLRILSGSRAEHLSGGERQMVAIARALMVPSKVILLDEPFEGLAPAVVDEVMDAVSALRSRASLVIVEHNADAVLGLADRAYVLVNGKVAYSGTARALADDVPIQQKLLGIAHHEDATEIMERAQRDARTFQENT